MERPFRHDRRTRARQAARVGEHHTISQRTRPTISSMATSFDGAGCGRGIAKWFGVTWEGFNGAVTPLEGQMTNDAEVWKTWRTKYGLVEPDLARVASPWHTDLDMGRPIEVMTDMALAANSASMSIKIRKRLSTTSSRPARGKDHSLGPEASRWMAAAERRTRQSRSRRLTGDEGRKDREDPRQPGPPAIR